jgi:hypothetical protein
MGIIEMAKEKAKEEGREESIMKLLKNTDFSDERIAKVMEVAVEKVTKLRSQELQKDGDS